MEENPVTCGTCNYANQCVANAAGFSPDQCGATPCNPTTSADCSTPPTGGTPENLPEGTPENLPETSTPAPCNPTTDANCPGPSSLQSTSDAATLGMGGLVAAIVAAFMA